MWIKLHRVQLRPRSPGAAGRRYAGALERNASPVKILPFVVLGSAGLALAWVAWRAPARDYVAPTAQEIEAHVAAPQALDGELPAGSVVRTIEVSGMCCTGCTGKLYARLEATPGFVKAAVSFERGVAELALPGGADPAPFVAALQFDKYDAKLRP